MPVACVDAAPERLCVYVYGIYGLLWKLLNYVAACWEFRVLLCACVLFGSVSTARRASARCLERVAGWLAAVCRCRDRVCGWVVCCWLETADMACLQRVQNESLYSMLCILCACECSQRARKHGSNSAWFSAVSAHGILYMYT